MVGRINKLSVEANTRGMDGIASLLATTAEAIETGGPEMLEFAVTMKRSWEQLHTKQTAVTPPGIVRTFPQSQRPGDPE
jgi:hypothetical protein